MVEMILFGDAVQVAEATGWGALGIAIVALLGTIANNWNNRKKDEDKLKYDIRVKELEIKAETLEKSSEECTKDRDVIRSQYQREMTEVKAKLQKCEDKHDTQESEIKKIWQRINDKDA